MTCLLNMSGIVDAIDMRKLFTVIQALISQCFSFLCKIYNIVVTHNKTFNVKMKIFTFTFFIKLAVRVFIIIITMVCDDGDNVSVLWCVSVRLGYVRL